SCALLALSLEADVVVLGVGLLVVGLAGRYVVVVRRSRRATRGWSPEGGGSGMAGTAADPASGAGETSGTARPPASLGEAALAPRAADAPVRARPARPAGRRRRRRRRRIAAV